MRSESYEFFKNLMATTSPSGFEAPGQKVWCDYARQFADEVTTDAYGNAVAVVNPDGDPKVVFDGHADELGMMVKYIDDKGFLYVQKIGGVDPALVRGKRVDVHTNQGPVRGVTGATAIHLQSRDDKDKKVPKWPELFIDIGAADGDDARRRVQVGNTVTFTDGFEMLSEHVGVARAFDNRVGTWCAIEALRLAAEHRDELQCAVYACSSVMEEVGGAGAAMNAANLKPDAAVVVDVTHATDSPGVDMKEHGEVKMGHGPTLSVGRENHPALNALIASVADKADIPIQYEAFGIAGGTNALSYYSKEGGIPCSVLGLPNRYMHTTVEMIDLRDMQRIADLLAAVARRIEKGQRFAVPV
ncbi:M20/M25/M40 family metallo-hydrolase [Phycisphaerales bacterium AB-hyl4]|uniref:M20/M25/M40 family metallo-hydrolase n=1 Tax=Natronomicrosphaera hydrolytica TaxID=3242702 RepID=A0ABV4UB85_9BACT